MIQQGCECTEHVQIFQMLEQLINIVRKIKDFSMVSADLLLPENIIEASLDKSLASLSRYMLTGENP